jgi:chitinase
VFSNNQWLIDTASNPQLGNWLLTDGSQGSGGTIVGGAGAANVVSYLKGLQAQGCKILLSIGGAGADLGTMFADSDGLAQAILGLLCGVAGVTGNPYNWKNTQFSDFAFDGIDLDLEAPAAGTPLPIASSAWSFSKSFQTYSTSKILTMAPESPYILGGTKSLLNFNGGYAAYSTVAPGTPLTSLNNQFEQLCPMFPNNNCLNRFDLMFIQIYNQGPGWYIGEDSFVTSLAMYGFMCLIAGRNCKVVIGLASADGNPVWDPTSVTAGSVTLNNAVTSANALIQAIGGGYTATQPADWLGGIGFWNSPSANAPMTAIYADNTLANLPANAGVLYCNNTANAQPPGWTGLIPLGRT